MLKLSLYHPAFGEPSASNFCSKAIYMMQLSGLDWQPEYVIDPRKAPMGKLPVLNDNGQIVPDSNLINAHLFAKHSVDLDAGLNDEQKATSTAVIRMIEEGMYFHLMHDRWMNDDVWPHVRDQYFSEIPKLIRGFVTNKLRKDVQKGLHAQGTGRFSEQQRLEKTAQDLESLDLLLGEKKYLFADTPTFADTTVIALLGSISGKTFDTDLIRMTNSNEKLMAYVERGKAAFNAAKFL